MIHHLVLFKLKPEADEETLEWMMRETRIQLLKIPEVLSIRCGKRIDPDSPWPFFLAVEIESREKLALFLSNPNHIKFRDEVIVPHIAKRVVLDYEMEPGKDVRYS